MSWVIKAIEWIFPAPRLKISAKVPWPEKDVRKAIWICMQPFFWRAIDRREILVLMMRNPLGHKNGAAASDGCLVVLDSDLTGVPLSKTGLAHELEHVRQAMLGNPQWTLHTEKFLSTVAANNRELARRGL